VRRVLIAFALLVAGSVARAATARLEVKPTTAHLGDPLDAVLTVDPGPDATVDASPLPTEWGPAQVLSGNWDPAAPGAPARVWRGRIAVYEIGAVTVPPVRVPIVGGAVPSEAASDPVALTIEGTLPAGEKGKDLADLKAPASIPPDWRPLKTALGGLAALLAAAGVAWWLWRRYAAKLAAVAAPVDPFRKLPPHVWVYEELERLLARRLAEEGRIGLFYDELTRIVKQYLEGRYRIDLLERTTSEVPAALKSAGAPADAAVLARTLLGVGDLVKFARENAGPEDCRAAVEEAYRLVDMTKPKVVAAEGQALAASGAAR
jgi:hypothetical protein